jgi:hypothetical protein
MNGWRTWRRTLGVVMLALVAGCVAPAGPTVSPQVAPPSITTIASPEPSAEPTAANASPSMSLAPTASLLPPPSASPSPPPTTAPKPSPTLNWDAVGYQASVKDPVSIGSKAKVILKGPVGPTCKLKITYASGVNATVPSPTHPKPGWWQWTWTIPSKAKAGTASGTSTCTYFGVPHTGDVSFKIVDPKPSGWSINLDVPATHAHDALEENGIMITVHVIGTLTVNPDYAKQQLVCQFWLSTAGNSSHASGFDLLWATGDPPITWEYQVPLTPNDIGTASWSMRCKNYYISPESWKSDSGAIEIT